MISVSPSEGTKVDKGSDVTLVVSSGKAKATVPGVVGKSFDEARSTLEAAGFRVTRTDQESTDKPADTVLAQSPGAAPRRSTRARRCRSPSPRSPRRST